MLFDTRSTQAAEASLDALWLQTKVISNNLSNVETPNFKASHVSFAQVLGDVYGGQETVGGVPTSRAAADMGAAALAGTAPAAAGVYARPAGGQENISGRAVGLSRAGTGARYRATVTRDDVSDVRIDGNNVSLEREQTDLWKAYAQYSYLLDSVAGHYRNIGTAVTNMKR